jgi:hypothetical protein
LREKLNILHTENQDQLHKRRGSQLNAGIMMGNDNKENIVDIDELEAETARL